MVCLLKYILLGCYVNIYIELGCYVNIYTWLLCKYIHFTWLLCKYIYILLGCYVVSSLLLLDNMSEMSMQCLKKIHATGYSLLFFVLEGIMES